MGWRERLLCPLSCRWRSDWHPCLQTRGRGIVAAKGDALERFSPVRTIRLRNVPIALQSRLPHPRRSCFVFAGWDSLIARSDHPRLRYSDELSTAYRLVGCLRWNERLSCPLSCRWRSDWLPCHPASQSLTSMPAYFTSLHY